jgi:NAD(P)H-hydrate epimerase
LFGAHLLDRETNALLFSRAGMRRVDQEALERHGIPGILLMERAALGLAREALALGHAARAPRPARGGQLPARGLAAPDPVGSTSVPTDARSAETDPPPGLHSRLTQALTFTCVCGPGNNGGDGWAAARLLHVAGLKVEVIEVAPPRPDSDAWQARAMASAVGVRVLALEHWAAGTGVACRPPTPEAGAKAAARPSARPTAGPVHAAAGAPASGLVVIDALLGTGTERPPEGEILKAIHAIRRARERGALVVAADLPSGLDADTGRPLEHAVEADLTVTFAGIKRGLIMPCAAAHVGRLVVVPIGVPRALLERHAIA